MREVFAVRHNFDKFRFLLETPETSKLFVERLIKKKVQWDASEMRKLEYHLFVDPKKKKDNRRLDFNVSCFHNGGILCDDETKQKFENKFGSSVLIFPVKTDLSRNFYMLTLCEELPASIGSLFENPQTASERHKYYFSEKVINGVTLFLDWKDPATLVTQDFIDWVTENDIKGMRFEFKGYIK